MKWSVNSENLAYAVERLWRDGEWDGDLLAFYQSPSSRIYYLYDRPANLYWQVISHDAVYGPSITLLGSYDDFAQLILSWFQHIPDVGSLTIEPLDDGYLIKNPELNGDLYLYDENLLQHLSLLAETLHAPTPLIEEPNEINELLPENEP